MLTKPSNTVKTLQQHIKPVTEREYERVCRKNKSEYQQ